MNWLKSLFKPKPKFRVTIYFKGGQTAEYKVLSFNAKHANNELTGIEWQLADDNDQLLYTRLDDVSHISSKRL